VVVVEALLPPLTQALKASFARRMAMQESSKQTPVASNTATIRTHEPEINIAILSN